MVKKDESKAVEEEIIKEDVKAEELEAAQESQIDFDMTSDQESPIDQEVDLMDAEKETGTGEETPAELGAINTDNETSDVLNRKVKKDEKKKKVRKEKEKTIKSKKYSESKKEVEENKVYSVKEASELIKKISYSKFDGTVTVDIKLVKPKKGDDSVRGVIKLPHGTGKTSKIAIASDELIEAVKQGKVDFDILITSPQMMPKLAQVAKILGPKGKMPNPKDGTVVEDPKTAQEEMMKLARYRADLGRNLHIPVGKVSWDSSKIEENVLAVQKALAHLKKESMNLSPTMGPSIKIETK